MKNRMKSKDLWQFFSHKYQYTVVVNSVRKHAIITRKIKNKNHRVFQINITAVNTLAVNSVRKHAIILFLTSNWTCFEYHAPALLLFEISSAAISPFRPLTIDNLG